MNSKSYFLSVGRRLILTILLGIVLLGLTGCSTSTVAPANVAATEVVAESTATSAPAALPGRPGGSASSTTATPTYADVAYASVSSAEKLDLYIPEGEGPFPLVLLVHGGAFLMGDKAAGDAITGVDQLLSLGYAVASVNYRLSGEALAPAQIQDVKAAVRFLRANAQEYKLNPEKFGAWGGSAGGSLVSLLGTSCGIAELEGAELGNADQSSCVQAVVDWFGPIDFLQMDTQFTGTSCPVNHDAANSPESMLVGAPVQDVPEKVAQVNAITYISADDPAFFIQHGTADCNVPPQQSQLLYDALKAAIGEENVTLTFLEGAGHGGSQFTTEANLKLVTDFFDQYLK
jgi:acetyl esterase/lipase